MDNDQAKFGEVVYCTEECYKGRCGPIIEKTRIWKGKPDYWPEWHWTIDDVDGKLTRPCTHFRKQPIKRKPKPRTLIEHLHRKGWMITDIFDVVEDYNKGGIAAIEGWWDGPGPNGKDPHSESLVEDIEEWRDSDELEPIDARPGNRHE